MGISTDDILINIETAIPYSLIINEIITNSLIYAYPNNRRGDSNINLKSIENEKLELRRPDNGIGVPKDFDFINTKSLGLQLIINLIEHQLQGELDIIRKTE